MTYPWCVVFLLLLAYIIPHSTLTSAPPSSSSKVSRLFLFEAAGKWGWEWGSSQPTQALFPCKSFAVELLTSRGQHKSVALHMLREALGFPHL